MGALIPHGITVDSKGIVWWGETVGSKFGRLDPKTGKMDRYPIDATGLFKTRATIRSSIRTTTSGSP
jgi:streptogramin lyase